jgi:membrane protease YdiL (CAAX protease family)
MKEFFEGIKIRKLVLVYVSLVVVFCIISELPVVKSSKLFDENLLLLLSNLGVLAWFVLKLKKSDIDVKKEIINVKITLEKKDIVLSILINVTLTIGILVAAVYALLYVWPSGMKGLLDELNQTDTSTLYGTIVYAIGASFIGPIAEEFMFIGVILNRLKMKMGIKKAIILSSILFGMIHLELGIISAVVFGICMSLIYLKTKNIFVTSTIHMINNFIVSAAQVVSFLMSKGAPEQSITANDFNLYWLILGILSLIAGVSMFVYFIKTNWRKEDSIIKRSISM